MAQAVRLSSLRRTRQARLKGPQTEKPNDAADAVSDEFLARKAKELGFTVEELKSAIKDWAKSVEDPYEKGLAALHELRYAEAS